MRSLKQLKKETELTRMESKVALNQCLLHYRLCRHLTARFIDRHPCFAFGGMALYGAAVAHQASLSPSLSRHFSRLIVRSVLPRIAGSR